MLATGFSRTYCEKLLGFKIHRETRFQLFEEVIAFVIHQDECREVDDVDFVNSFHTELRILNALNAADGLSRQVGSNTADGAEIEAAVFLAGFGNDVCTVALSDHDVRAAGALNGSAYGPYG